VRLLERHRPAHALEDRGEALPVGFVEAGENLALERAAAPFALGTLCGEVSRVLEHQTQRLEHELRALGVARLRELVEAGPAPEAQQVRAELVPDPPSVMSCRQALERRTRRELEDRVRHAQLACKASHAPQLLVGLQ
jgi:hypothetical protein